MDDVFDFLRASREKHVRQLEDYLRMPSVSSDPQRASAVMQCARFTAQLLEEAGLEQVVVHTTQGLPLVVGSWKKAPNRPTVLVYGHYDVQPVDPPDLWEQDPFSPHYRNDRIFARGATDDKGQVLMHIQAVSAMLKTTGSLPVNLVFLLEGEEEIGSPNLPAFMADHKADLKADIALVSDSSMWAQGVPSITTTLRGLVLLELTVTGPGRDLHSGSFGGAIANPVEMLARMLATIKDADGNIVIPGFHDQAREASSLSRQHLAQLPFDEVAFLNAVGLSQGWGASGYTLLERTWLRPTFEINGLWGGHTGPGAKTVLPSKAHAKVSLRLVPDQDPDAMVALVTQHLTAMTPPQVTLQIDRIPGGGGPLSVPTEWPALNAARRALRESFQREPLLMGEGGSIPAVADFEKMLGIKTLLVGFGLPEANTHAPNENLHIPTFHTGTESLVRLFHYLASE